MVSVFNYEGRPVQFDTWLDDLQLYLQRDSKDSVSLFDLASGAAPAPPATADRATCSQWLTRDAAARLAIRNHLPLAECAHFGQHRIAEALYDAVVARYHSPANAALGRLLLPYPFPELSAFTIVEDLVSHLRTSDARYRATVPAEDHFLSLDPTSLTVDLLEQHLLAAETSAVAVGAARGTPRPPFFEGCSPSPLAVEGAAVEVVAAVGVVAGVGVLVAAVEAAVGVATVAAVGLVAGGLAFGVEVLEVASESSSNVGARPRQEQRTHGRLAQRHHWATGSAPPDYWHCWQHDGCLHPTSLYCRTPHSHTPCCTPRFTHTPPPSTTPSTHTHPPPSAAAAAVGDGVGGGAGDATHPPPPYPPLLLHLQQGMEEKGGGGGAVHGACRGQQGAQGSRAAGRAGRTGQQGSRAHGAHRAAGRAGRSRAGGFATPATPIPSPTAAPAAEGTTGCCSYVIRTGDRAGQTCGKLHTQHRCFSRLDDAWRAEFGDDVELPRWADLLRSRIAIFELDFDAILFAMYALSVSAEGDCYRCVSPDPGIVAVALGASESGTLLSTTPAQALHTFTLDSGASRCFIRDSTTLTPLLAPVPVRLAADPSGCPVVARSSTVLPCPPVPSGSLSGLHLPSFSTNLTLLWHHRLGHPSLPRLCGMHSRLLVYGLPRSLPPLSPSPAPPCLPCVEGRQRAAPHSSSFPPTTAPLQTLHMDVWGPARVSGQSRMRYFLLVVDDYTRYTTVFPLHSKSQVVDVLIPWIRTVLLQLREQFGQDLLVLRLHPVRGGEFPSNLLREFCRGEGILQSFTLPDSPHQNGIAERRIGLVMEVVCTSMIHVAAPHFLWPFAVQYGAHQLNLWPRVSLPETSPTLRWTGKVGDASVFRVWGSRAFVRDPSADKLSAHVIPCVFLGFLPDAHGWQLKTTLPCAVSSPLRTSHPPSGAVPGEVAVDSSAARGTASGGSETGGIEHGGVETGGAERGGVEPEGVEPGGAASEGAESGGAEPQGAALSGGSAGASPRLSPQQLREWFVRRTHLRSGATGAGGAGAGGDGIGAGVGVTGGTATTGPGGARTRESRAACAGGSGTGGAEAGGAGVGGTSAGGAGVGGTGAGGARAGGAGAVDLGGAVRSRSYFVHLLQQSEGLTGRREPASRPVSPICIARRLPRSHPPLVLGTHVMTLPSALVAESASACLPSVEGGCALGTDVLEDMQEEFECLAAAVPRFTSMLLAPEGDPDAPDIPTPRSYAEAITCPYSSQWQAAMDAKMASWKSTRTYVDKVPPPWANIVDGMLILGVKRPPGSPPAFKARYVALGLSQQQGFDYFQTFSPTPKMTTLRVLVHVAAQHDYELHSLDFSTAFLTGSLHKELWLRCPPGFTGSLPAGTQWSLWRPVYGLRQAPREWYDTLKTTLAALGFAPSTADPSLFLRTDNLLPPFYVLVYVDDLVLQRFGFQFSSPQPTPLSTSHSLSDPPLDESVEPSGPYPELVGCLMYLMTCTRPDLAYPLSLLARYMAPGRHRKGYTFSLGLGSVSLRSTRSSSVLNSSCEAEIYAGAMAAYELRRLTYLLTDLGEQPRLPSLLYQCGQLRLAYVATRAKTTDIFTKALPPGDHQRFSTVLGLLALLFLTGGPFYLVLRSRVPPSPLLLQPPESSLTVFHDLLSNYLRASRPVVSRVLSALVTHPSAPVLSISTIFTIVAGFASSHHLDYAAHLVSGPACSSSSGGAPVFPLEVLEDRQFELGFLAASVPHLCTMLLAPEGDPDGLDIPIPRTNAEAVSGP
ncbi:unnamed protein product [Closterium sp. NIES-53]